MGLSIYKTVDVKAAPDGIGIKLAEIEKAVKDQGQAQLTAQRQLEQIPAEFRLKIADLDKVVKDQGAAQIAQFRKLDDMRPIVQRASADNVADTPSNWLFGQHYLQPGYRFELDPAGGGTLYGRSIKDLRRPITPRATDLKSQFNLNPDILDGYLKLAQLYESSGESTKAIEAYNLAVDFLMVKLSELKAADPVKK